MAGRVFHGVGGNVPNRHGVGGGSMTNFIHSCATPPSLNRSRLERFGARRARRGRRGVVVVAVAAARTFGGEGRLAAAARGGGAAAALAAARRGRARGRRGCDVGDRGGAQLELERADRLQRGGGDDAVRRARDVVPVEVAPRLRGGTTSSSGEKIAS